MADFMGCLQTREGHIFVSLIRGSYREVEPPRHAFQAEISHRHSSMLLGYLKPNARRFVGSFHFRAADFLRPGSPAEIAGERATVMADLDYRSYVEIPCVIVEARFNPWDRVYDCDFTSECATKFEPPFDAAQFTIATDAMREQGFDAAADWMLAKIAKEVERRKLVGEI
jgi:hypothetical protein